MRSQRIPAKQYMNKSLFDQPGQGLSSPGMNDGGSTGQQDMRICLPLTAALFQLTHPSCDVGDDMAMGPFSRDLGLHKPKYISLLRTLQRYDAHPLSTNHDLVSLTNFTHRHGLGDGTRLVDRDREVHLDSIHVQPSTIEPDLGGQMRRGVEIIG